VNDEEITQILQAEGSDQDKVDNLIDKALVAGGRDNITVVLVEAPASVTRADSDTEVPDEAGDDNDEEDRDDSVTRVMDKNR
ncbi:MAG: hypothetical protein QGH75_16120, partial [Pseudomonadales bacterium]|nr:hypothetical protein [Pseudomonadales bacterium]